MAKERQLVTTRESNRSTSKGFNFKNGRKIRPVKVDYQRHQARMLQSVLGEARTTFEE